MKTYLFILLALIAVASSCKSKKEKENPKIQGAWIFTTPMGMNQYWEMKDGGVYEITMPEQKDYKQTGKWTMKVTETDSMFEMTMDIPNATPMLWNIKQHSDSVLVLVQKRGEQDMEIKLHK